MSNQVSLIIPNHCVEDIEKLYYLFDELEIFVFAVVGIDYR